MIILIVIQADKLADKQILLVVALQLEVII
jgi:hypothetical protein